MRSGRLKLINDDVSLLLESRNKGREDGKKLVLSHLGSQVLHATQGGFVTMLVEAADFYVENSTKSIAFHDPSFIVLRAVAAKSVPFVRLV